MFDWREVSQRRGIAATLTVLAGLSILAPLRPAASPETSVGLFLIAGAILEWVHGQRRPTAAERLSAWREGAVTLLMAALLLGAPLLSGNALVIFLAVSFIVEGVRHLTRGLRRRGRQPAAAPDRRRPRHRRRRGAAAVPARQRRRGLDRGRGRRLPAVRCRAGASAAPASLTERRSRRFADRGPATARRPRTEGARRHARTRGRGARAGRPRLGDGVPGHAARHSRRPHGRRAVAQQPARPGRRGARRRRSSPCSFTMGVALPFHLMLQRVSHPFERRAWRWLVTRTPASRRGRLRVRRGAHGADVAPPLRDAVAAGPPLAAGGRRARRAHRPAVCRDHRGDGPDVGHELVLRHRELGRRPLQLVGGDPHRRLARGHGAGRDGVGASGRARPRLQRVAAGPGRRRSRSSSSATPAKAMPRSTCCATSCCPSPRARRCGSSWCRPTSSIRPGAMRDYEAKFWLPFKGVTKPVFAIPGNHDWYDALEGFNATFLTAGAARAAMAARVNADLKISTTTAGRIDELVAEAARLRREYDVPTGFQRAPFFDIQTDTFALLAVDTGVVKRVDDEQLVWLEQALARARGKTILAVLGHPFYAGGMDLRPGHEDFQKLYDLLKAHDVAIVMAGDTHDLEHYVEPDRRRRHDAARGERRRRRLPELRLGARVAGGARARHTGRTTPRRPRPSPRSTRRRRGGSGPPGGGRAASAPGPSPPNGCRRPSTTTPRRSSRASSRCASSRVV